MTADITKDERTAKIENGKFVMGIVQEQSYDIENVHNMLKAWEVQIDSLKGWLETYKSGEVLNGALGDLKAQLKKQREFCDTQIADLDKGLKVFMPVYDKWKKDHPKEYTELLKTIEERNARLKNKAISKVQNANVSELNPEILNDG